MKKKIGILGLAAMLLLSFAGCDNSSGSPKPEENDKPTASCENLLDEAVDNFAELKLDEGIAKIEEAYNRERNDTTRMYYALAKLALVSTNSDTLNFMQKTCGFESYPNKLNAIITEPWWDGCLQDGFTEKVAKANPKGFNDALNQLVSILEKTYDEVVGISKDMGQASVTLPAKLVNALGLEELFGSSDILMGKAEIDVVIAATGLVKGALEYVSAFDWTFDTSSIKTDMDVDDFITAVQSGTKLLTVTDTSMLEKSKKSFIDAADLAMSSYDYAIGTNEVYPSEAKDVLREYKIFYDAAKALKDALNNGKTFYVPDADIFYLKEWPPVTDDGNYLVKIDCKKMFDSGVANNAIEKDDSGKVKFYTQYESWGHYSYKNKQNDGCYDYKYGDIDIPESEVVPLTGSFYYVHNKNVEEVKTALKKAIDALPENATTIEWECKTDLLIKVRLPDCININGIDGSDSETYLPVWGKFTDSYDEDY